MVISVQQHPPRNNTSFSLPATDAGKRVYLDFDGVMAMPTVYINGHKVGGWDYGYVAFRVDASEFIKPGQAREDATAFMRVKRGQWIGALVGEETKPGLALAS